MARRPAVDQVRDVLYAVPGELCRFAMAHVAYADMAARASLDELLDEVEADLVDACEGVHPKKNDGLERRAALVRLVARAMVLLAIDEVKRGSRTVEQDMDQLDEIGNVKRAVRVQKQKGE